MLKKSPRKVLEICCFSLKSSKTAHEGGADRIELCGSLPEGGTTPSAGLLSSVLSEVSIPVYTMIRPRGGDFYFNEEEMQVMLTDIKILKEIKPAGFVIGALDKTGNIDLEKTSRLLDAIGDFPVTFHRAIDMCKNPLMAIEQLISLGIENILTSGQYPTALEGLGNLRDFKATAANRINIMAGSGVNPSNILKISEAGVDAFHFSAKKSIPSQMLYRNEKIQMGDKNADEYATYEADLNLIKQGTELIEILNKG
ncbi:copper homeostasis protein CutC [Lacihabitans sp. LS3-19]|uniref:copper homeostasis protein CutC n=1 Tax=Lacihabitans sp. LS3-19 TaxID=2487335 RepID=UPI0020CCCA66|nr:copper homeostasis protein CutC [Lacihabitans sp. LS3-19]MCP9767963.1 copper homeostasis protein CutC [Lacihabitans sp. LS3-19]